MRKLSICVICLSAFTTSYLLAQDAFLLKIPETSDQQLYSLRQRYGVKLRYRTPNFSIVQGDRSARHALYTAEVLDRVLPRFNYYLLRVDGPTTAEKYGEIVDEFGGLFLIKLLGSLEGKLFEIPGHNRARVPTEVYIPQSDGRFFAPSVLRLPQQQVAIRSLLQDVDVSRWIAQITALTENESLDQPGQLFRSRYSLRVREAVQFDGKPEPDHACDNAADYIAQQFRDYGLSVEFDSFVHRRRSALGNLLGEYVMRNVVATLPGKGPNRDRVYLMVGHYDSISSKSAGWHDNWRVLPALGASDNASGIAELLETARILSQQAFDFTIRFVAFSGEELFLFGSKHYSRLVAARGDPIAGVLNFDLLGHDADGILDVHVLGDEQSQWLVNAFATVAERYGIEVDLRKKNDPGFIFSDHSPFWEIGVPAVMIAEESTFDAPESTDYIHSEEDTLEKITPRLGQVAVQLAVGTLAELAGPMLGPDQAINGAPDIYWEPAEINVSQTVASKYELIIVSATLRNSGPVSVEGLTVQFIAIRPDGDTDLISEQNIDLDAGESQMVETAFSASMPGIFTLRGIVNNDTRVFESDFGNNSIETELGVTAGRLTIDSIMAYPNPINFGLRDAVLNLSYVLDRDVDVTVALYTGIGEKIYEQLFQAGTNGGRMGLNDAFNWEGRNSHGNQVSGGVYICQINAIGSDGESKNANIKLAVISHL